MSDIIYPTLDLFLYDLRNGLGESQAEIEQNRTYFQKKLPASVHPLLFQKDNYFEVEYQELLPKIHGFETPAEPDSLQGYYYPVRLGDTYGLILDCSINNQTEPQPAQSFATLKAEIEQRSHGETATIGQSWIMSGWLPHPESQNPDAIAKACYQSLMPQGNWQQDLEGQGQFLGATIYELKRYRLVMKEDTDITNLANLQDNQHILIILYPDRAAAETAARFYDDWLRLFCYRNKILWAYSQSRLLKQTIKHHFAAIEAGRRSIDWARSQGREFDKVRQHLEQTQDILNRYTINLNQLDFQARTIDINLSNYKKRVARIAKQSESDLAFLEEFSELVTDKYLLQIHKDTENLERGLRLLEDTINAIRSRVELDKAERDRNFQDTVAVIGVGWTVGSFVASLDKLGEDKQDPIRLLISNSQLVPKPWVEPAIPLTYTLTVALAAALVTWLIRRFWS
jgi:hypothetical protein